jgi:hypothetical protein
VKATKSMVTTPNATIKLHDRSLAPESIYRALAASKPVACR